MEIDNEEEDIIPDTPGRKRVRKQIDKIYTDEDGFICEFDLIILIFSYADRGALRCAHHGFRISLDSLKVSGLDNIICCILYSSTSL